MDILLELERGTGKILHLILDAAALLKMESIGERQQLVNRPKSDRLGKRNAREKQAVRFGRVF